MSNLQSVSIIAAFPIGIVMILIVASFIKDAKKHLAEKESAKAVPAITKEVSED